MFSPLRFVVRWGLIGTLVAGGSLFAYSAVTQQRAGDVFSSVAYNARVNIQEIIDAHSDDPRALYRTLNRLQAEYPEKIREVQKKLFDVEGRMTKAEKALRVSQHVTKSTLEDLAFLNDELQAFATTTSTRRTRGIELNGRLFNAEEAVTEARRIRAIHESGLQEAAMAKQQYELLSAQHEELTNIAEKIKHDHQTMQANIEMLAARIRTIETNEYILDQKREQELALAEIKEMGNFYDINSLDSWMAKTDEIIRLQQGELDDFSEVDQRKDYREEAEAELNGEVYINNHDPFAGLFTGEVLEYSCEGSNCSDF